MRNVLAIASFCAALTASVATWWVTYDLLTAKHRAEMLELREGATIAFNKASAASLEIERENYANAQKLELSNAKNRKAIDAALSENRRLSRELGGMRDPYAIGCSGSVPSTSSSTGVVTPNSTNGRLSEEAEEFLFEFAKDADEAASYAMTCHDFAKSISQ